MEGERSVQHDPIKGRRLDSRAAWRSETARLGREAVGSIQLNPPAKRPEHRRRMRAALLVADKDDLSARLREEMLEGRTPILQPEVCAVRRVPVCPVQPAAKIKRAKIRTKVKVPKCPPYSVG